MICLTHLHLSDAFIQSDFQPFTQRRRSQACKATAILLGAVRGRCLAQGHLDTQLASNLLVTTHPPYLS